MTNFLSTLSITPNFWALAHFFGGVSVGITIGWLAYHWILSKKNGEFYDMITQAFLDDNKITLLSVNYQLITVLEKVLDKLSKR